MKRSIRLVSISRAAGKRHKAAVTSAAREIETRRIERFMDQVLLQTGRADWTGDGGGAPESSAAPEDHDSAASSIPGGQASLPARDRAGQARVPARRPRISK